MTLLDAGMVDAWVQSPYTLLILSALSFSESAFFIIPPEVLLIPLSLANQSMALWYGALTVLTSIFGATLGYWIGQKGGQPILKKLFKEHHIAVVKNLFQKYNTKAIVISAFIPIPFKVLTISGGAFDLNFKRFVLAALISRSIRYFLVSGFIMFFGEPIKIFIENDLDKFVALGTLGLVVLFGTYKFFVPLIEQRLLKMTFKDKMTAIWRHWRN